MGIKPVLIISLWFYSKCCLLAQTRMSSPSISADHYITHLSEAKLQSRPVLYGKSGKTKTFLLVSLTNTFIHFLLYLM